MFKEVPSKRSNVVCKVIIFVVSQINNMHFFHSKWREKIIYSSKQNHSDAGYMYQYV